jgi:hypothetical protein
MGKLNRKRKEKNPVKLPFEELYARKCQSLKNLRKEHPEKIHNFKKYQRLKIIPFSE